MWLLGPYALFHVLETTWGTQGGRVFATSRVGINGELLFEIIEAIFVIVPFIAYGALMVVRMLRSREPLPQSLVCGVIDIAALWFICIHIGHTWLSKVQGKTDGFGAYQQLRSALGSPLGLAIYSVGITALCLHMAHAIPEFVRAWRRGGQNARPLQWAVNMMALGVWLACLNTVSHFSAGKAWLPVPVHADSEGRGSALPYTELPE